MSITLLLLIAVFHSANTGYWVNHSPTKALHELPLFCLKSTHIKCKNTHMEFHIMISNNFKNICLVILWFFLSTIGMYECTLCIADLCRTKKQKIWHCGNKKPNLKIVTFGKKCQLLVALMQNNYCSPSKCMFYNVLLMLFGMCLLSLSPQTPCCLHCTGPHPWNCQQVFPGNRQSQFVSGSAVWNTSWRGRREKIEEDRK